MATTGFYCHHKTPVGILLLAGDGNTLWRIAFADPATGQAQTLADCGLTAQAGTWTKNPQAFDRVMSELDEYFAGTRQQFDLELLPAGTAFQQKVWQTLQTIPYGQTRSYLDVATAMGQPRAARAVGMANNRNPLPIVIPCHRVIGKNGQLVGFGGGLAVKRQLLQLEAASPGKR